MCLLVHGGTCCVCQVLLCCADVQTAHLLLLQSEDSKSRYLSINQQEWSWEHRVLWLEVKAHVD